MFSGLKKLLFGNRIKRVANYGNGLAQLGKLFIALTLTDYISKHYSISDEEYAARRAACWTNYLFGDSPSPIHSDFDLDFEHAKAVDWLRNRSDDYQAVVIQGLRILNTSNFALTGLADIQGKDLLKAFGRGFPDSPDLDQYALLVNELSLSALQEDHRNSLYRWIITGPYASYFKTSKVFGWP